MKKFSLLLVLLAIAGTGYGQGTQISGSQIKDGAITNAKIKSDAAISYTKLDFTNAPASIINAENPLTFNSPLSRTGNTISLTVVPVTLGGTGLTSATAGRLLFGGNSTTLGTSANLTFDSGTNTFSTNKGVFASDLTVGGTFSINGKTYTWPSAYGAAGSVLTDVAGNGTVTWEPTASAGITLQSTDPGTPDTGGLNITGKGFFGSSVHMQANPIYFNTSGTDTNDFVRWDNGNDHIQMFGYAGVDIGASILGAVPAFSVQQVSEGQEQILLAPARFSDITSGNLTAAPLAVGSAPVITNIGTPGAASVTYQIGAFLLDGSMTLGAPQFTGTANATLDNDNYNSIVWTRVPGAYKYRVYRVATTGSPSSVGLLADNITFLFYDDKGTAGDNLPVPLDSTGIVKGKFHTTTLGTPVATGATIAVTGSVFHITDAATPIDTIVVPYTGFVGTITLLPDATFTTTTSGNIILGSTAVVGKALILTYDGTKWYPSY